MRRCHLHEALRCQATLRDLYLSYVVSVKINILATIINLAVFWVVIKREFHGHVGSHVVRPPVSDNVEFVTPTQLRLTRKPPDEYH